MAKSKNNKKFNLTYSELFEQALEKLTNAERDITDLSIVGIDAAQIALFSATIEAYKNIESDELMQNLISVEVEKKDLTRLDLETKISDIMGSATLALGSSTAEFRSFRYKKTEQKSDADFLFEADFICDRADYYATELNHKGTSAADVLAIRNLLPLFKSQMKLVVNAKNNREIETQNRLVKSNEMYLQLTQICNAGKVFYQNKNEAKYNDYIIYDSPENVQRRAGRLTKGEIKSRSLTGITEASNVVAINEGSVSIEIYFSQKIAGNPFMKSITLLPNETKTFNVANDLGFLKSKKCTNFTIKNLGDDLAIYRMKFLG